MPDSLSRTSHITAAVLAASMTFGVAIYVLSELILPVAQADTPRAYCLAALLFLPIILSYSACANEARGGGGAYRIVRDGPPEVVFLVGWLTLGGYVALGALLARWVASVLGGVLDRGLGLDVDVAWLVLGTVGAATVSSRVFACGRGISRGVIVALAVAATVLAIPMRVFEVPARFGEVSRFDGHSLTAVALLAAALWSIELVWERRACARYGAAMARCLALVWVGVNALGFAGTLLALRWVDGSDAASVAGLPWVVGPLGPFGLTTGASLCWSTIARSLSSGARLGSAMATDGFLPERFAMAPDARRLSGYSVGSLGLVTVAAAVALPALVLAGVAALAFLWTTILVLVPYAVRSRSLSTAPRRSVARHPFVPSVSVATSVFCSAILPGPSLGLGVAWVAVGLLTYVTYARPGSMVVERRARVVGDHPHRPPKGGFRVLVDASTDPAAESLIRAGQAIARARHGEIVVLQVVSLEDQITPDEARDLADERWRRLSHRLRGAADAALPVRAIVRVAASRAAGVLSSATEYHADLLLLGWSNRADCEAADWSVIQRVFAASHRPLAVMRGALLAPAKRVLVATGGGPHSPVALQYGAALAAADGGTVDVLSVVRPPKSGARASAVMRQTLEAARGVGAVESRVAHAKGLKDGILREADGHDVLLMGVAIDRLLQRPQLEGESTEIARARSQPTLLVKRHETRIGFWRRRAWDLVAGLLPPLTLRERARVLWQMRYSARASVDFYFLVLVASLIAAFGLIQNSGAVVIGAMLVAPLMSPILATAHGIVLGHVPMIRRGCASTLKGMTVAVAVGTAAGLPMQGLEASAEILARGQPNLFDLMVALASGAVAAYAISRRATAAALPGVAISAALVPPLCVVGYGLGASNFSLAGGAMLLFMTNLCAIVLVGAVVFLMLGVRPASGLRGPQFKRAMHVSLASLMVLAAVLAAISHRSVLRARVSAQVDAMFREAVVDRFRLHDLSVARRGDEFVVDATIYSFEQPESGTLERLGRQLSRATGVPVRIRATLIAATLTETGEPGPSTDPEPATTERPGEPTRPRLETAGGPS